MTDEPGEHGRADRGERLVGRRCGGCWRSEQGAGRPAAGARRTAPSGGLARAGSGVTELAAVCVPALCDECLIQIAEHGRRPYRIRRAWPDMTGTPPSLTDEAFIAVTQGRGTPLEWGRTGGAVVETTERDVLARFTNPPGDGPDYHGVLVCRWTEGMPPTRAMPGWSGCSPNMSSRLSTANAPPVRSTPATWPRTSRPL